LNYDENLARERRKDEHVDLALGLKRDSESHFDQLIFVHHSLPNIDWNDVDLQVQLSHFTLKTPIYINAMTGGSKRTGTINGELAKVAQATGMAMAVGSQHAGLRNEAVVDTYKIVRRYNPDGIVFANVGADVPEHLALKAIDMLEANALQIHINVPQELVMPEGGREFSTWLSGIENIVKQVEIPVIVKEVGFGMSSNTIAQLKNVGVKYVDVSGRGGTNFIGIENERRQKKEYDYLKTWGQTTPIALLEAHKFMEDMTIFASGGIRNPLDIIKALSLGASATGIARPVLKLIHDEGADSAIKEMLSWQDQLRTIMTMLGATNIYELRNAPLLITKDVREWCELRGIEVKPFAQRKWKHDSTF